MLFYLISLFLGFISGAVVPRSNDLLMLTEKPNILSLIYLKQQIFLLSIRIKVCCKCCPNNNSNYDDDDEDARQIVRDREKSKTRSQQCLVQVSKKKKKKKWHCSMCTT